VKDFGARFREGVLVWGRCVSLLAVTRLFYVYYHSTWREDCYGSMKLTVIWGPTIYLPPVKCGFHTTDCSVCWNVGDKDIFQNYFRTFLNPDIELYWNKYYFIFRYLRRNIYDSLYSEPGFTSYVYNFGAWVWREEIDTIWGYVLCTANRPSINNYSVM
jgi:hypothetical protein